MNQYLPKIIRDSEGRAELFERNQITDRQSDQYGGFVEEKLWTQPKSTIYKLTTLLSLYNTPQSRYYHSGEAMERIQAALDYVIRFQHEDGTFDYVNCNFHSAPDTAFCVKRLLPSFLFLQKNRDVPGSGEALKKIEGILRRGAEGIRQGGFHTPNHRWAIASVLMACANLFQEEKLRARAEEYLREGIDCNQYGEFSERSSGNYNRVNDEAMLTLYEETGDRQYLDCAVRNLKMMFSYFEPDGTIFTKNSTRYDSWKKVYPKDYYFDYLYLAYLTKEPVFAAAANRIMEDILARGDRTPDCLNRFLIHPELADYEPQGCGFPEKCRMENPASGIVRVRSGNVSCTMLSKTPYFLYFQAGALSVCARLGIIFFDKRSFQPDGISVGPEGCTLTQTMKGWYYTPFREKPKTSDWWEMDNASREIAPGPDLRITLSAAEEEDGIALRIRTEGCERVPFKIELGVESGCFVRTDGFLCTASAGEKIVARTGSLELSKGPDCIKIGPCFGSHFHIGGKDGAEDTDDTLFHIYFTGFTNTDRTIRFQRVSRRFPESDSL